MGWRNRSARATLGRAIKHADTLADILSKMHAISTASDLDNEAVFFDGAAIRTVALLVDLLDVWQEWYGKLPEDLANRPVVQILKMLEDNHEQIKTEI